ncbi:leucine-rich_repeat domain-containing protein [Hexamita inflata]|uniref:Leucine-rich_repeat domain-containing protein n=1 Tax=Hexamita inflata TaxID=28002 RepID=A0ABP1HQU7_9EUKA
MTEQNQNNVNMQYDEYLALKYESKIQNGTLLIDPENREDPEVSNLRFIEKLNIQVLKVYIDKIMTVKLKTDTIKELTVNYTLTYLLGSESSECIKNIQKQQRLNVNNLELENLEVLDLKDTFLENDQLYNLAKFKKLRSLNVSNNRVDLLNIHNITSLTKLSMSYCSLQNIDLISSLVNLQELNLNGNSILDLSSLLKLKCLTKLYMCSCILKNINQIIYQISQLVNLEEFDLSSLFFTDIDISPLCKLKNLTKLNLSFSYYLKGIDQIWQLTLEVLNISATGLKNTDSIGPLINLKELDISENLNIEDITPLKDLVGLIKLNMNRCGIAHLSALKYLINLQFLDISSNYKIDDINQLQYLKNLTRLRVQCCSVISICALRPLVNLEYLNIEKNQIVYVDANLNNMTNLQHLNVYHNYVREFSSFEQHQNYNLLGKHYGISAQISDPSEELLTKAKQLRLIEIPNIQLKEIQHKTLKTALNNFKQQINSEMSNALSKQLQFTANVVRLFQHLNQFGFE